MLRGSRSSRHSRGKAKDSMGTRARRILPLDRRRCRSNPRRIWRCREKPIWRKLLLPGQLGSAYEPTCLDDILRGGVGEVKCSRICRICGALDRCIPLRTCGDCKPCLGSTAIGSEEGGRPQAGQNNRVRLWEVVEIMDALLSEKPRKRAGVRGRPRMLWLSDPMKRVLLR